MWQLDHYSEDPKGQIKQRGEGWLKQIELCEQSDGFANSGFRDKLIDASAFWDKQFAGVALRIAEQEFEWSSSSCHALKTRDMGVHVLVRG